MHLPSFLIYQSAKLIKQNTNQNISGWEFYQHWTVFPGMYYC